MSIVGVLAGSSLLATLHYDNGRKRSEHKQSGQKGSANHNANNRTRREVVAAARGRRCAVGFGAIDRGCSEHQCACGDASYERKKSRVSGGLKNCEAKKIKGIMHG